MPEKPSAFTVSLVIAAVTGAGTASTPSSRSVHADGALEP